MASKTTKKADAAELELEKAESEYAHLHPLASQGNDVAPITRGELRIILEDLVGKIGAGVPVATGSPTSTSAPAAPDPQAIENKKAIGQLFAAMIGNERKVEGKIAENTKHLQGLLDSVGANERGFGEKIAENAKHIEGLLATVGQSERDLGGRIDAHDALLAQLAHAGMELETHVNDLKKQLAELRTQVTGNTHEIGEIVGAFKVVHDATVVQ